MSSSYPIKKRFILFPGVWIIPTLLFILLTVFAYLAEQIADEESFALDGLMFEKFSLLNSSLFTKVMQTVTFFGSKHFLIPAYVVIVLYFLLIKQDLVLAITIGLIRITSKFLIIGSKSVFQRTRPEDPLVTPAGGFSFPSGHAISAFTFVGLLIYLVWRMNIHKLLKISISLVLLFCGCIIAFSRVYLRVHYTSDVIAGFCLGVILLLTMLGFMHLLYRKLPGQESKMLQF